MVGIIDYGLGNIMAIRNIYLKEKIPVKLIKNCDDFDKVTHIILPGVGSFDNAMNLLNSSGLKKQLDNLVLNKKIPVLGICVGMQILGLKSDEGKLSGLGWINGNVIKFKNTSNKKFRIPHMGWNSIDPKNINLFKGLNNNSHFYFLHSYYFELLENNNTIAKTNYINSFSSAINLNNIYGVQFHPEKSHNNGITILKNFYSL